MIRDRFNGNNICRYHTFYNTKNLEIVEQKKVLLNGLSEIIQWKEKYIKEKLSSPDTQKLIDPAIAIVKDLQNLNQKELSFENRSDIRKKKNKWLDTIRDEDQYEAILEIYDRLYNSSITQSINEKSSMISTARNDQNIYIQAAEALIEMTLNKITVPNTSNVIPQWGQYTSFSLIENPKIGDALSKITWDVVWKAYLDNDWKKSLYEMNSAFSKYNNLRKKYTENDDEISDLKKILEEKIANHTSNVVNLLKDTNIEGAIKQKPTTGEIIFDISSTIGAPIIYIISGISLNPSLQNILTWGLLSIPIIVLSYKYSGPIIKDHITNGQIRSVLLV